ncbi:MAG: DUF934 domain-containing protein [Bacillota bacterium]
MPLEARIIKLGGGSSGSRARVETDAWRMLTVDEAQGELPRGSIVVPLAAWKARGEELRARLEPTGVWLAPDDDPADIADDARALALVAIQFPKVGDGRGYSTAVLLRTRYRYRGELRAFGDLGRDQLFFLRRCGFDAFSLGPGKDPEAALAAFDTFSVHYQGSADEPLPLFHRRGGVAVHP